MTTEDPTASVEVFLKVADQYKLGDLPTEQSHPRTENLSELAKQDLAKALQLLRDVDLHALQTLRERYEDLLPLQRQMARTLNQGHRIFLCGCGATGRLALSLEYIWRQIHPESDAVRSFMAGGDVALVHALEGFEDHPGRGARQLEHAGFSPGDLLICCTEGGETPFVIGAAQHATTLSAEPVYFLFCNPKGILERKLERCRDIFANPGVRAIELCVGPMALCGSTRMQASTVLMLAVGAAMLSPSPHHLRLLLEEFLADFDDLSYEDLLPLTENEADCYARGERIIYSLDDLAIAIFTDTTERAPTFSLRAFQPEGDVAVGELASWSFIECRSAKTPPDAWQKILGREPRPLQWPEVHVKSTTEYLNRFNFSAGAQARRGQRWPQLKFNVLNFEFKHKVFRFNLESTETRFAVRSAHPLFHHLFLKMLMNAHSTLLMGRQGRFEGNWMTYVTPTNAKLIDRATRYVLGLLARDDLQIPYEKVVREVFAQRDGSLKRQSPLVMDVYEALKAGARR